MSGQEPVVGCWYQMPGQQLFEVVAVDDDSETIEIQYFEGEVEELDKDVWSELPLEEVEPPEDWSGAYDEIDREDLGYAEIAAKPDGWNDPLLALELAE